MTRMNEMIESHYHLDGLYEIIVDRINDMGIDIGKITDSHIARVDEFHVRGAEVSKELAKGLDLDGCNVLDLGCGIGGPARMLAREFNARVTGVDLSQEYIRTAAKLSELTGLAERMKFIQADALDMPFENAVFDVVWTQHVQMNIRDKARLYAETKRVLKDGGLFIYYDILKGSNEDINYPVPWANDQSVSFLATASEMEGYLKDLDFEEVSEEDQTSKGIDFLVGLSIKMKLNGSPKLGLDVLMGNSTEEKFANILDGLKKHKIVLQSGIYKKH